MGWNNLNEKQRSELYRRYAAKTDITVLAQETGLKSATLERNLRRWAQTQRGGVPLKKVGKDFVPATVVTPVAVDRGLPTPEDMFELLKKEPVTLDQLSKKFDRSKETIRKMVVEMQRAGYVIEEEKGKVSFKGDVRPIIPTKLPKTLADEHGQDLAIAVVSDTHAGSAHSQPTNRKRFMDMAYHDYGVRVFVDPGDCTSGLYGYRGQEYDLIPASRQVYKRPYLVTQQQIDLYNAYTPKYEGAEFYTIGGNHDYWHVVNSGIDAVARICKGRDDHHFLGYDVADLPLTDRVDLRLWHPSGGVPYALSYRLQKGMEQTAFDELTRSAEEGDNPKLRILVAGHMHIEVKFSRGPLTALHPGCFEGQTNYLKRKGLVPQVGGAILRVRVSDGGMIQRVEYTFVSFVEIHDDWMNWPTPEVEDVLQEPDDVDVIFRVRNNDDDHQDGGAT